MSASTAATTDLRLSSTAYSYAAICLKKYQYRFVDKLVPKPKNLGLPLRRGIWIHSCLEALMRNEDWTAVLVELQNQAREFEMEEAKIVQLTEHVTDIIEGHIDYWDDHDDDPLEPKIIEQELELPINDYLTLSVTPDLVGRNSKGLWVVENKSVVEIPPPSWLSVDPQTAIQYVALIRNGFAPVGIMFNYLLTRPAPVLKFKQKDLLPYATKIAATTTVAFEHALRYPGVRELMAVSPEYASTIEQKRAEIVNDGVFYQRYYAFRPKAQLLETFADVSHVVKNIRLAMQLGHFPRAWHPVTCRKFCHYGDLCAQEYLLGRVAPQLRTASFDIDDGSREGVTARERVLARLALESVAEIEGLDEW